MEEEKKHRPETDYINYWNRKNELALTLIIIIMAGAFSNLNGIVMKNFYIFDADYIFYN